MSRGRVQLEVSRGLPEVLADPWVQEHLEEVESPAGNPGAGWLSLVSVDTFDGSALASSAPDACWQAFCGADTDTPNLWLGHSPETGVIEADHVDGSVVVPLDWANPGAGNEAGQAHVRRLVALAEQLDAHWHAPALGPEPLDDPLQLPAAPVPAPADAARSSR